MDKAHILIVDDEEAIREVVSTLLEAQGYNCTTRGNGLLACEYLKKNSVGVVLLDVKGGIYEHNARLAQLLNLDGDAVTAASLAEWIGKNDGDIPVVMVTAMHDISTALEAIRRGAYDYILKPFEKDQLYLGVRRALERRRLVMERRLGTARVRQH